jgi:hypothetical protein
VALSIILKELWPIRFLFVKKTSQLTLDSNRFQNNENMVVHVWRWKQMKSVKVLAHYNEDKDKFTLAEIK